MDIREVLLQWFISFLIKNSGSGVNNENMSHKELPEELHKPNIKKKLKKKITLTFHRQSLGC